MWGGFQGLENRLLVFCWDTPLVVEQEVEDEVVEQVLFFDEDEK
jgi:hypothetical protein